MNDNLQDLVKRYQAGEDVRGEIENIICDMEIDLKVINQEEYLSGQDTEGNIFSSSLDYALENYSFDKNTKFTSYFYIVYRSRLINEYNKVNREQSGGATIRDMMAFNEEVKNILGSPVDHEIIKENTKIFDDEVLNRLKDKEKDYIALYLTFGMKNIQLTDDVAGQVLSRTRRTVINYRNKLREILQDYGEYKELMRKRARQVAAENKDLSLLNEYGAPDPTARDAVKRIRYGAPIDEDQFDLVPEGITDNCGTIGIILTPRADVEPVENGYCNKCHMPLTIEKKCSNTNMCNG